MGIFSRIIRIIWVNIYSYILNPKLSDFEFGSTILPLPLVKYRDC